MKHTKGKWEVKESDGVLTIVCTDLNNRKYYIGDVNGDADYEPTYRANANLMASAPKLLQTLIDMLNMVNCWTPPSGDKDKEQSKKIVCNAIDIIAKAEGK